MVFRFLRLALAAQALLLPSAPLQAQATSGQELLDFVREAHRAACEAIRTCSCRVEFLTPARTRSGISQSGSGRFWISPDAVRANISEFGEDVDYLWKDSVRQSVVRHTSNGNKQVGAGRSGYANSYLNRCDPRTRGLLVFNVPSRGNDPFPFEQFVAEATRFVKAERESVDGKDTIVTQFIFEGTKDRPADWDVEVQFDPAANYLARKVRYSSSGALAKKVCSSANRRWSNSTNARRASSSLCG